jgi:hypothetical protein
MKKVYKFGDILITANFKGVWSCPEWSKEKRPEYNITISQKGNANKIRHSVKAWGGIGPNQNPDEQHKSLSGLVLMEHLKNPESFKDFCLDYGYDEDSRKAERIWNNLKRCYNFGKWLKLAKEGDKPRNYDKFRPLTQFEKWEKLGGEIEEFIIEL